MRESYLPVSRHLPVAVTVAVAVRACPIRRSAISDGSSDGHAYGRKNNHLANSRTRPGLVLVYTAVQNS